MGVEWEWNGNGTGVERLVHGNFLHRLYIPTHHSPVHVAACTHTNTCIYIIHEIVYTARFNKEVFFFQV